MEFGIGSGACVGPCCLVKGRVEELGDLCRHDASSSSEFVLLCVEAALVKTELKEGRPDDDCTLLRLAKYFDTWNSLEVNDPRTNTTNKLNSLSFLTYKL